MPVADENVTVDLARGGASMTVRDIAVLDHSTIPNALTGSGPAPQPATVSFQVVWSGSGGSAVVGNGAQGFSGEFLRGTAQMEWSATVGDYQFTSAPLATSSSSFAEIGRERNGMFFNSG